MIPLIRKRRPPPSTLFIGDELALITFHLKLDERPLIKTYTGLLFNMFKRLTAVRGPSFYRFEHVVPYCSGKSSSKVNLLRRKYQARL